ncbi:hypothetical protein [Pseudorhodoplanes sp.]|uniref:hypothetical protein n=1 Tax=Pseudorhodoplanes sp. TaxID=1934341 RepID=UPI002BDD498B|nr:hypothetical protein [Pseudorhodoplanes sp.]HWV54627.1 hypothetical protein [Pseudorhodoplanes sp.]
MSGRVLPAKAVLQDQRRRTTANWNRLLVRPIRMPDGTLLFTLKDAAQRLIEMPSTPSTRVAAERIMDAALHEGDMPATHAAVRLALLSRE